MFLVVDFGIRFALIGCLRGNFGRNGLVERFENIFGVDERNNSVEVDGAAQSFVDPKEGGEITWIGKPGGFEEDIIKSAATIHECFDGVYTGVSGRYVGEGVGKVKAQRSGNGMGKEERRVGGKGKVTLRNNRYIHYRHQAILPLAHYRC